MSVLPDECGQYDRLLHYINQPIDLISWFKKNPPKVFATGKRFPWQEDLDGFSNPVIAIGKCKE